MKRRFIIVMSTATMFLALASAQTASTQPAQDPKQGTTSGTEGRFEGRHKRMAGKFANELGLTDAQKTQLKSIHEQQRAELNALRNDSSLTQEQRREKFMEIRKAGRTQFEGVLTPDQLTKMKEARKNHGGPRGRHGKRGGHGPKPGAVEGTGPGVTS